MKLVAGRLVRERGATAPAIALCFNVSTKVAHDICRRAMQGLDTDE